MRALWRFYPFSPFFDRDLKFDFLGILQAISRVRLVMSDYDERHDKTAAVMAMIGILGALLRALNGINCFAVVI